MANNRIRFSNDFILKNEKVGINTTEPRALLDVGGDLYVSGIATINQTTIENLSLSNSGIAVTAILDEDDFSSNRDDALATQQSIKSYIDTRVGNVDLNFSADSGIGTVDLNTEIFDIKGTANEIETSGVGTTLTIGLSSDVRIGNDLDVLGNLNVSGISTISGVVISTGIITSSNPGVTTVVYYGDGSNLEGVAAFYVDTQVNATDPVYPTLAAGVGVNNVGISTNKLVFIESTTRLGIGTTNPVTELHVIGDVTATNFNSTSDLKLKTNIQQITDPLEKLTQIQGVSFNWIENNKPSMGVIADEVQKVLPELVSDTDPKTVNYNGLIGLLIECVKQQQVEIEELKRKVG
jgi:hypothetical protein